MESKARRGFLKVAHMGFLNVGASEGNWSDP